MLYKSMLLKKFWTKSIGRQLMLGIVLVHAVLMSIFVIDLVGREKTFLIDLSQKQAIGLAQTLATNGSSWVLAQDFIGMEEIINSQSSFPDIKYALFLDTKLKVLAFTDSKQVGKYLDDDISKTLLKAKAKTNLLLDNFGYIDVAAPIMANNRHIGWARVGISRKGITNNIKHVTQKGIFYTLFAIIVGVIFAWFMSRSITVDIRRLVSSANKLEAGESINFTLNREDELGQMADNFQSLNETLDDKVKTRTRQVTEANNQLEQTISELKITQNELIESEKMASLGGLVAGVAHEINTPIGIGVTAASLLSEQTNEFTAIYKSGKMKRSALAQFVDDVRDNNTQVLSNLN
ncbi:MAG: HAMP domain-containing protein, partial [Proteobacteria bacterium]|nr:HAMP domain-containing protein [Pseudomonadota bacterium]